MELYTMYKRKMVPSPPKQSRQIGRCYRDYRSIPIDPFYVSLSQFTWSMVLKAKKEGEGGGDGGALAFAIALLITF